MQMSAVFVSNEHDRMHLPQERLQSARVEARNTQAFLRGKGKKLSREKPSGPTAMKRGDVGKRRLQRDKKDGAETQPFHRQPAESIEGLQQRRKTVYGSGAAVVGHAAGELEAAALILCLRGLLIGRLIDARMQSTQRPGGLIREEL